jgi:hypothetical protein
MDINHPSNEFVVVYLKNGQQIEEYHWKVCTFKQAKKNVVTLFGRYLEMAYGRGEHIIQLWSVEYQDMTTPERYAVGFGPEWKAFKHEKVFEM